MKSRSLLTIPLDDEFAWFWLVVGSGLIQVVTLSLLILIGTEWPWHKFMLLALAIGACGAFTTGLYVALVLIGAKFLEKLYEPAGRTDATPILELRRDKVQKDDFPGTSPVAA